MSFAAAVGPRVHASCSNTRLYAALRLYCAFFVVYTLLVIWQVIRGESYAAKDLSDRVVTFGLTV